MGTRNFLIATGLIALTFAGGNGQVKAQSTQTTCTNVFTGVLLGPSQHYFSGNCHVYQFIDMPGISWGEARSIAALVQVGGRRGYLATVASQAQLNFIEQNVIPGGASTTANVYIGGQRVGGAQVTTWQWVGGPLRGVVFWNKGPVSGRFAPWDPIHFNDAGPSIQLSWALYLNAWYRPYFTSAWDVANYTGVGAGANTGFVVEYGP